MTKRLMPMLDDPRESPQLRELLEVGRNASVTDYDFDQGLRRHLAQVEAGAALPQWAQSLQAGGTVAATGGALGSSLWLWIGLPLIAVSAMSAIAVILSNDPAAVPPAPVVAAAAAAPTAVPSTVEAAPAMEGAQPAPRANVNAPRIEAPAMERAEAVQTNRSARRSRPVASAAPSHRAEEAASVVGGAPVARRAEIPVTQGRPAKVVATTPLATKVVPAARAAQEPEEQPVAQREAAKPEPKPPVDEARLEREMGMLAMTQRVLFTDPARALNLARQGEAEFEGSMFTQERQQLLLLALVKLGRLDEAKRLARPYLARYPHGPFSDRVRRSLATGRVDR